MRLFASIVLLTALLSADAVAADSWRRLEPASSPGEACLDNGGTRMTWLRLDADGAAVFRVKGPRRLKLVTRHLFAADAPDTTSYALTVRFGETSSVVRGHDTRPRRGLAHCDADGRVGVLRRSYVTVPSGTHDVRVSAACADGGAVALRAFRELRRRDRRWVSFAPERYRTVRHLQFDSGSRTSYYVFDPDRSLVWSVTGPTTLEIWTRLDFDHTMSGAQPYAVEVLMDGAVHDTYQFDTEKLDAAVWVERNDILPGERRTVRVKVPRGEHRVELRCLRPAGCALAGRARIPEDDVR